LNGKSLDLKQLSSIPAILERLAKLEAATTGVACMGAPKIFLELNIIGPKVFLNLRYYFSKIIIGPEVLFNLRYYWA